MIASESDQLFWQRFNKRFLTLGWFLGWKNKWSTGNRGYVDTSWQILQVNFAILKIKLLTFHSKYLVVSEKLLLESFCRSQILKVPLLAKNLLELTVPKLRKMSSAIFSKKCIPWFSKTARRTAPAQTKFWYCQNEF